MVWRINGNYRPTPPSYTPDIATRVYTRYSRVIASKKIPYKSLLITEEIAEVLCGRLFPLISNVVAHLLILLSSNISGDGQVAIHVEHV